MLSMPKAGAFICISNAPQSFVEIHDALIDDRLPGISGLSRRQSMIKVDVSEFNVGR